MTSFYPLSLPKAPQDLSDSPTFWTSRVLEWLEGFRGTPAFSPSLIEPDHAPEIADAIVDALKQGWLDPHQLGALGDLLADPATEEAGRLRLRNDEAIRVTITSSGRRALRCMRFYRQLKSASTDMLTKLKDEITRVLAHPSPEHEPDDLDELRDELIVIAELLQEAG
ncbi:MAG TPA: hypothetical protein VH165_01930 [Kofleriaceae bacterium]|nr:hypothetical protein [Kofleriaceae bacterium]